MKVRAFILLDLKILFEFYFFHTFNYKKIKKVQEIWKLNNSSTEREEFEPK